VKKNEKENILAKEKKEKGGRIIWKHIKKKEKKKKI